ncbi:hypothetical protein Tco_1549590, partial [Tanacetum coccineum]
VGQGVSGARDLVGARDSKVNYADRATPMFTPNEIGQFFLMLIWIFSVSVLANSCYNLSILRVKKTSTRKQAIFYAIIIFTSLIIALENGSKLVIEANVEEVHALVVVTRINKYGCVARHVEHEFHFFKVIKEIVDPGQIRFVEYGWVEFEISQGERMERVDERESGGEMRLERTERVHEKFKEDEDDVGWKVQMEVGEKRSGSADSVRWDELVNRLERQKSVKVLVRESSGGGELMVVRSDSIVREENLEGSWWREGELGKEKDLDYVREMVRVRSWGRELEGDFVVGLAILGSRWTVLAFAVSEVDESTLRKIVQLYERRKRREKVSSPGKSGGRKGKVVDEDSNRFRRYKMDCTVRICIVREIQIEYSGRRIIESLMNVRREMKLKINGECSVVELGCRDIAERLSTMSLGKRRDSPRSGRKACMDDGRDARDVAKRGFRKHELRVVEMREEEGYIDEMGREIRRGDDWSGCMRWGNDGRRETGRGGKEWKWRVERGGAKRRGWVDMMREIVGGGREGGEERKWYEVERDGGCSDIDCVRRVGVCANREGRDEAMLDCSLSQGGSYEDVVGEEDDLG